MPERIAFTMASLAKIKPPSSGRKWYYDAKVGGLALQVTQAGSKSFYFYRRIDGVPEKIRIGAFPDTNIDTARNVAMKYNAAVASGENPSKEKQSKRTALTIQTLFDLYLEVHAVPHKKQSSVATDKATYRRYLTAYSGRKISSFTQADIRAIHGKIGKDSGKVAANRLHALLSKMFTVAIENESLTVNPCVGVKTFEEKSRDRFLQPEELPRFLKAVDGLENQRIANAFRLMLLTGARKGNVLSMRWEDLDLNGSNWRMPDTKANEPQTIHLSPVAVEILRSMERDQSGFVFPARTAGGVGHLQHIVKQWKEVCKVGELSQLRIHDLRRSLGSWMAKEGASLQVIGKQLGHHDASTTMIYSRLNLDPIRPMVDSAVEAMMRAGKQPQSIEINANLESK